MGGNAAWTNSFTHHFFSWSGLGCWPLWSRPGTKDLGLGLLFTSCTMVLMPPVTCSAVCLWWLVLTQTTTILGQICSSSPFSNCQSTCYVLSLAIPKLSTCRGEKSSCQISHWYISWTQESLMKMALCSLSFLWAMNQCEGTSSVCCPAHPTPAGTCQCLLLLTHLGATAHAGSNVFFKGKLPYLKKYKQ